MKNVMLIWKSESLKMFLDGNILKGTAQRNWTITYYRLYKEGIDGGAN
ncbi:MAG: hypothetical protein J6F30_15880 [Cellulosilyticum sp.]|nr:hypothetical protein [Cellulosilyticum sp.]